jgi:transcriptional regulator with XRE-family HTH domain
MADLYERIGQRIRELRLSYRRGSLSQEGLAAELKVAANTVSRWETGTYKPRPEDLDKLARFFGVSITTFFPDLPNENADVLALTSATAGLGKKDMEEVLRYAEFRKARRATEKAKRARGQK